MPGTAKAAEKAINISELVSSMTRELDYYWSLGEVLEGAERLCVIHRVQKHIRDVDRFSYEPFILSVGPYHHGASRLLPADKIKWAYLDYMLRLNKNKTLIDYLSTIQELSKEARLCYSEDIKMDNERFVQMLVLDGCFILVALGGTSEIAARMQQSSSSTGNLQETITESRQEPGKQTYGSENSDSTSIENMVAHDGQNQNDGNVEEQDDQWSDRVGQWFARFTDHDLLLLENQIPMFIIRKLFDVLADNEVIHPPFTDGLARYIEISLRFYPKVIHETEKPTDFHHLLHLCHMYFKPSEKFEDFQYQIGPRYIERFLSFGRKYLKLGHLTEYDEQSSLINGVDVFQANHQLNRWRRAAQYIEAGVEFKKRGYDKDDPHSLLDIRFIYGTMEIPCYLLMNTQALFSEI